MKHVNNINTSSKHLYFLNVSKQEFIFFKKKCIYEVHIASILSVVPFSQI